jgi:hypothetical protein
MMASAGQPGAQTGPNALVRIARSWRALSREQRVSALAALALFITMFLPWYSVTAARGAVGASLSAWSAFGLVQALVMVISLGTLVVLFVRGERRALGGESRDSALLVLTGGALAAILILYAMFDRPGGSLAIASGISWGIVIALLTAIWLGWTGLAAMRSHRGAPASPAAVEGAPERRMTRRERRGDEEVPVEARWVEPHAPRHADAAAVRDKGASAGGDVSQLSLELPHDHFDE